MMYIPREWFKNKDNKDKVYDILDKLDIDIVISGSEYTIDQAIYDLNAIGESKIAEQLEK